MPLNTHRSMDAASFSLQCVAPSTLHAAVSDVQWKRTFKCAVSVATWRIGVE